MISYSHAQLLKSMLEYEIRNSIEPTIMNVQSGRVKMESCDYSQLLTAKEYIEKRIKELAA
jgi:hypothetical protein